MESLTHSRYSEIGDDVTFVTNGPLSPFTTLLIVLHEAVVRLAGLELSGPLGSK